MYADYFSLTEKPFSITPDPAYLFLSKRHEEALAHLLYGVTDSGGFIQLTGEVGTGKTTIIRSLFERIPDHVEIALILNPRMSESEFLHAICDELLIPITKESTNKECFDALNHYLLDAHSQGRKVVLMVDEAQNLAVNVLEYIRLLTNLETAKDKLLQIILVGQPELQTLLKRQDLRQLAQRITARYHLAPLNKAESEAYIEHRLKVAGAHTEIFTSTAKQKIYQASQGIPRLINVLSDRALLGAYSQEKVKVDSKLAKQVIKEVLGQDQSKTSKNRVFTKAIPVFAIAAGLGFLLSFFFWKNKLPDNVAADTPTVDSQIESSATSQLSGLEQINSNESLETATMPIETQSEKNKDEVVETVEKVLSLNQVFSEYSTVTTAEQSINSLLKLWDKEHLSDVADVCLKIMSEDLRCLYRTAQWQDLLTVNRPVILELRDEANTIHHLLVAKADENTAWLQLNEQRVQVNVEEIQALWKGDYLLFWQADESYLDATIQFGSNGQDVIWLKEKLQALNILPATDSKNSFFGTITKMQVVSFQKQYGLVADGKVGRESFIAINNALGLTNPPKLKPADSTEVVN